VNTEVHILTFFME